MFSSFSPIDVNIHVRDFLSASSTSPSPQFSTSSSSSPSPPSSHQSPSPPPSNPPSSHNPPLIPLPNHPPPDPPIDVRRSSRTHTKPAYLQQYDCCNAAVHHSSNPSSNVTCNHSVTSFCTPNSTCFSVLTPTNQ